MLNFAKFPLLSVTLHRARTPIGLPRNGAEISAGVGRHVDANMMRTFIVNLIDTFTRSRESGQRHASPLEA